MYEERLCTTGCSNLAVSMRGRDDCFAEALLVTWCRCTTHKTNWHTYFMRSLYGVSLWNCFIMIHVFWNASPCSITYIDRPTALIPWRWRQFLPLKDRSIAHYTLSFQKTEIFSLAVTEPQISRERSIVPNKFQKLSIIQSRKRYRLKLLSPNYSQYTLLASARLNRVQSFTEEACKHTW